MKLVFATNNQHKLEEFQRIVGERFEILSLKDIGCHDDIPETSSTLEGNAMQKARWVKEKYGYDCFADDTGLMVDALNGAPGVFSARYAGPDCCADENINRLLSELADVDYDKRTARFRTVIVLIFNGHTYTFDGNVEGYIARERHGNGGFGYDPVFIPVETNRSFAEMTADEKNAISHRGRATAKLCAFIGRY